MNGPVVVPSLVKGAEQAVGAGGYGRRRRPMRAIFNEGSYYLPYCEAVMAEIQTRMRSIQPSITYSNSTLPNIEHTIKDGTEDANHNGKIDGDNGDGTWSDSEVWTELNPKSEDTDGDTFSDNDEKSWGYNPLSKDTDGDGLDDNIEDNSNPGTKDSTETSVIKSDTDGDGLSDKMEQDGWTVIIIYEATLEIKEEREVNSDPLITDYDEDGINDCGEFENGTDPNNADTDNDGFNDKEEIDYDYGSSPTGIDGKPPTISNFDTSYALREEVSGPLWDIKISVDYVVKIWISADDIFGLEWVNVHLEGVGDVKLFTGYVTSIENQKFEFTLSVEKAVSSLFNSFGVNITASDQNENIGYKAEEVKRISEIVINNIVGTLKKIINIIKELSLLLYNFIKEQIFDIFSLSTIDKLFNINYIDYNLQMLWDESNLLNRLMSSVSKRIGILIEPIVNIYTNIKNDIEGIFQVPLSVLISNMDTDIFIDSSKTIKENVNGILIYIDNIIIGFLNTISWKWLKLSSFISIIMSLINNIYTNNELDILNPFGLFKDIDPNSIESLEFLPIEMTKGFTEDAWFNVVWQAFSIVSLLIDILILVFNVVYATILWYAWETIYGFIGAVGFTILSIMSIIPIVLDLLCYNYFWGLITHKSKDVSNDSWGMLIKRSIIFPAVSCIIGYYSASGFSASISMGQAGWILSIPDGINFIAGTLFYGDVKWI